MILPGLKQNFGDKLNEIHGGETEFCNATNSFVSKSARSYKLSRQLELLNKPTGCFCNNL